MEPIGVIHSEKKRGDRHDPMLYPAQIEILPHLQDALYRLDEHSHIWVICWFQPSKPFSLRMSALHAHESAGDFGALALRSPNHPNPVALSLCQLIAINGHTIDIDRLDAYDGTPVLDIKPYFSYDMAFSARIPHIQNRDPAHQQASLRQIGFAYHGETCLGLSLAVRVALAVQSKGLILTDPQLSLSIWGDPCLADCLQGLCRARLAHPPRFSYQKHDTSLCHFTQGAKTLSIEIMPDLPQDPERILELPSDALFTTRSNF
jgi:tRNA-Thr(GGU) m(6)t(6)A37 methyltransferase TsaA